MSLVLLSVAINLGKGDALKQENFTLLDVNSDKAVVRIYGDNLLVIEFNRETKKISNSFFLIKRDTLDLTNPLVVEEVGPLINPNSDGKILYNFPL